MRPKYRTYMASDAWLENPARFEALRSAGFRCRICNVDSSKAPLHVYLCGGIGFVPHRWGARLGRTGRYYRCP